MNQKQRMLAGLPYKCWLDNLEEEREACKIKIYEFNQLHPSKEDDIPNHLKRILGKMGDNVWIKPPFYCDYGSNIEIGDNFFANYGLTILDICKVTIGNNVMFGPHVSLYGATHPLHPQSRNSGYESGDLITIGDNCWLGGNVVVNPGVTIGENTVIGSGSVVTKDIPANVIAVGNPCKVIRKITEADRHFYTKNKRFDVEDY